MVYHLSKNKKTIASIKGLQQYLPNNLVKTVVKKQILNRNKYFSSNNLFKTLEVKNVNLSYIMVLLNRNSSSYDLEFIDEDKFKEEIEDIVIIYSVIDPNSTLNRFISDYSVYNFEINIYLKFSKINKYIKLSCSINTTDTTNNNGLRNRIHRKNNIKIEKLKSGSKIEDDLIEIGTVIGRTVGTLRYRKGNNRKRYNSITSLSLLWINLIYQSYYTNRSNNIKNIKQNGLSILKQFVNKEFKNKPTINRSNIVTNNLLRLTENQRRIQVNNRSIHLTKYYTTQLPKKYQTQIKSLSKRPKVHKSTSLKIQKGHQR